MKKIHILSALAVLALLLTACTRPAFGLSENTAKHMTITAERAPKDAFFMTGSLEVADGEQFEITSNLTEGSIRVEIVGAAEEQSIDVLPATDGAAILTADLRNADAVAASVRAALSQEYDLLENTRELERAGSSLRIEASVPKGTGRMGSQIQVVYIIPAPDGCRVATAHYAVEAAEGFGRRFSYLLNTLAVLG